MNLHKCKYDGKSFVVTFSNYLSFGKLRTLFEMFAATAKQKRVLFMTSCENEIKPELPVNCLYKCMKQWRVLFS